jgi:membrane-associated phospholipid phosphatase
VIAGLADAVRADWTADAARHGPDVGADQCCALALALLVLTGLTLYAVGGYHAGFHAVNGLAPGLPRWLWQGLTMLGDERAAIALALLLARRHPHVLYAIVVAAVLATLANRGIKLGADQLRPPAVLPSDAFHLLGPANRRLSFPSGHTVTAFVFFGALAYHFRRWRVPLLALAATAGLSRVAIGVHWPIDVVAGACIGLGAVWAAAHIAHRARAGTSPYLHFALVALAVGGAVLLVVDDGGYESSLWIRLPIAAAGIGAAVWSYLVAPWRGSSARGGPPTRDRA